jgi:carbonic anhydrase
MLTFGDDDLKTAIEHEAGIRPPFALEAFSEVDADVRQSIARIEASRFSPHKDQLRGFVYEVTTGKWREVTEST